MTAQKRKMTLKQRAAADHYLAHGMKSDAYRHAYKPTKMKPSTVNRRAFDLFEIPHVKAYVEENQKKVTEKAIFTRERAIQILAEIAEGKISDFITEDGEVDTEKVSKSGHTIESFRQAITDGGTTRSIKVRDPISAIDRIAKLEGWDKQNASDGNITFILKM